MTGMPARKSRDQLMADALNDNPDILWVPPQWEARMREAGMHHAWVRFIDPNQKPDKYLPQKFRQGYEFVEKDQCVEWETPPSLDFGSYGSIIAVGDLALMICPKDLVDIRRKRNEDRANAQVKAVRQNLMSQSTKLFPIEDNSKTHVTGARTTKFAE